MYEKEEVQFGFIHLHISSKHSMLNYLIIVLLTLYKPNIQLLYLIRISNVYIQTFLLFYVGLLLNWYYHIYLYNCNWDFTKSSLIYYSFKFLIQINIFIINIHSNFSATIQLYIHELWVICIIWLQNRFTLLCGLGRRRISHQTENYLFIRTRQEISFTL